MLGLGGGRKTRGLDFLLGYPGSSVCSGVHKWVSITQQREEKKYVGLISCHCRVFGDDTVKDNLSNLGVNLV
jgi:hypothetical protein